MGATVLAKPLPHVVVGTKDGAIVVFGPYPSGAEALFGVRLCETRFGGWAFFVRPLMSIGDAAIPVLVVQ